MQISVHLINLRNPTAHRLQGTDEVKEHLRPRGGEGQQRSERAKPQPLVGTAQHATLLHSIFAPQDAFGKRRLGLA